MRVNAPAAGRTEATREWPRGLHEEWMSAPRGLPDPEWASTERTRWPFIEGPFHRAVAPVNLDPMKNAAAIGYCRFLYASR